jgi:hypothetical protein
MRKILIGLAALAASGLLVTGCGSSTPVSGADSTGGAAAGGTSGGVTIDLSCDKAPYPSVKWTACEVANFARIGEAPLEQLDPAFLARVLEQSPINLEQWTTRAAADPSWLSPKALDTIATPVCATWQAICIGDPFAYPQAKGADGAGFFDNEVDVSPVVFYDRDCARLSGHIWAPKGSGTGSNLPTVVILDGSIQATETVYWWAMQALVRDGYVVMTYDPRGQGKSDWQAPDGQQGGNLNIKVFWLDGADAIDFLHSTPTRPYPRNQSCAGTYPTQMTPYNPMWDRIDPTRLGVAGHSAGAIGVSVLQGYGAPGADPWPGLLDQSNPISAAVAWDGVIGPGGIDATPDDIYFLPPAVTNLLTQVITMGELPKFGVRAPMMIMAADYALLDPTPYLTPPNPELHKGAFALWQSYGVPVYEITVQGTYHADFSPSVGFPATSWCPDPGSGVCRNGWALPVYTTYTLNWFDRWLKHPAEQNFAAADTGLLADDGPQGATKMSFRFYSARDYPDRGGIRQHCEDIRGGC